MRESAGCLKIGSEIESRWCSTATLPWRRRVDSLRAQREASRGGVSLSKITPPRSLTSFAHDPPPPGEGEDRPSGNSLRRLRPDLEIPIENLLAGHERHIGFPPD